MQPSSGRSQKISISKYETKFPGSQPRMYLRANKAVDPRLVTHENCFHKVHFFTTCLVFYQTFWTDSSASWPSTLTVNNRTKDNIFSLNLYSLPSSLDHSLL